jgi:hypothetical protein
VGAGELALDVDLRAGGDALEVEEGEAALGELRDREPVLVAGDELVGPLVEVIEGELAVGVGQVDAGRAVRWTEGRGLSLVAPLGSVLPVSV